MDEHSRQIACARLLRRQGKTYAEIRAALGLSVGDDRLQAWLKGIPRPAQTFRSHPKAEQRRRARMLRASGLTYDDIARQLNVSTSSLSLWLRDQPAPARRHHDQRAHLAKIQPLGVRRRRENAAAEKARWRTRAAGDIANVPPAALFIAGLALYWAEGAKDKPWRRDGRVIFVNSDPDVLSVFLAWLDLVGVPEADRRYRLTIHERADVQRNEEWWASQMGLSATSFRPATLKRHTPHTTRQNTGDGYHGCLVVSVVRSRWLYYSIEGWWSAIVSGVDCMSASGRLGGDRSAVEVIGNPLGFDPRIPGSSPGSGAMDGWVEWRATQSRRSHPKRSACD